jgi:hypothetical protein
MTIPVRPFSPCPTQTRPRHNRSKGSIVARRTDIAVVSLNVRFREYAEAPTWWPPGRFLTQSGYHRDHRLAFSDIFSHRGPVPDFGFCCYPDRCPAASFISQMSPVAKRFWLNGSRQRKCFGNSGHVAGAMCRFDASGEAHNCHQVRF